MNFDEHEGHELPRVYVSEREPRYVAIWPGHEGIGPWSPAVHVAPRRGSTQEGDRIAPHARPQPDTGGWDAVEPDAAAVDEWFRVPLPPSNEREWQAWVVSELALAALRGVEREFPGLHYHVAVSCNDDERRACGLARYFSAHDERFIARDEHHVFVSTGDIEDVAFLAGYHLRRALCPFVTVLARATGFVAALYFDWDDDRFYLAEKDGVVLRHVLWAASASGFDVVNDHGYIFMMSGTADYVAELRAWIDGGGIGLPQAAG